MTEEPLTPAEEDLELEDDDELDDEEYILDVGDLAPSRRKIRTDAGDVIELYSPKELSLAKRAKVDRLKNTYDGLQRKKKLTNAQLASLEDVIDKLAREAIAEIDDEEFEELSLLDKEAAITVFTTAFGAMLTKLAEGTVRTLGLGRNSDEDEDQDAEIPES